jgi:hypothetical protein
MSMDTKTLVVGQKVRMQSGSLLKEATVTDITEEYIEVKPVSFGQGENPWMIRFQKDGKQFSVEDLVKRTGSYIDWKYLGNLGVYDWTCRGWERHDPRPGGEGGYLWELEDF